MSPQPDLLAEVPLGGALKGLLRLLLSSDRRDEFLGDLIEEANLRLRTGSRAEVGIWLWSQALRSAPSLVSWRIRRLLLDPRAGALVVAGRGGRRGLSLSLAVSVSAHALVLTGAIAMVLSKVEEINPPFVRDLSAAILSEPVSEEIVEPKTALLTEAIDQMRRQRVRTGRRPMAPPRPQIPAPADALGPPSGDAPATLTQVTMPVVAAPTGAAGQLHRNPSGEPRLRLPPRVGEKRCLSCPTPQLPHPYARLGIGREMLVKTCVGIRGEVTSVQVLRGFDPTVNAQVTETIRRWQMAPYSLDGHPVPFCYETRFLFTTH